MIAIFKREIRNYLKRPLFWVGILLVIYGGLTHAANYLAANVRGASFSQRFA